MRSTHRLRFAALVALAAVLSLTNDDSEGKNSELLSGSVRAL